MLPQYHCCQILIDRYFIKIINILTEEINKEVQKPYASVLELPPI